MTATKTIKTSEIVYRKDLYPRFEPDPKTIQQYAECLEQLPPIEVDQHGILIDGYHRWKAHETARSEEVPCVVTQVASEQELFMLAVKRNAKHGKQLSTKEKQKITAQWFGVFNRREIIATLSITDDQYDRWTKEKRELAEEAEREAVLELYLECRTHEEIASRLNIGRSTVTERIGEIVEKPESRDSDIFSDFERPADDDAKSTRQLYSIWNFPKATNEVRHFGNIPPEIIENLLFYFTKPFDVVFDPFGGGGSTIDKCRERKRRYYVSDLNPISAREHQIRKHDISTGLPKDLPVPDLVFLDPPYWQQAKEKYSADATDLGNVTLDSFLDTIGNIARDIKAKWKDRDRGILSLIIGPCKESGEYIDLPFLCYERIKKYLKPKQRVIVPYSTQVHGGAYVKQAKDNKEILYLHRDLMLFSK